MPVRDLAWYPAALPLAAQRDDVDVLHCPTHRAPLRSRVPLVVTVHDLAVLRHPETFNRWTRTYSRLTLPRIVRAARRLITVSEFQQRELLDAARRARGEGARHPERGRAAVQADGAGGRGRLRARRATLEPRKNLPRLVEGFRRAGLGCELRIAGARGWGDVEVGGDGVRLARRGRRRGAGRALPRRALRRLRLALRGLRPAGARGDGLRHAGRRRPHAAADEFAGGAAVLVDPLDPDAIAAGLPRRSTGATSSARSAASGRARSTGSEVARATRRGLPRGGRVSEPLVVIDADVLGRQRTGDESYVENLLRELAPSRDLRFAAVTRRPGLVPDGIEPVELPARARSGAWRLGLPRLLRGLDPALAHFLHASRRSTRVARS